MQATLDKARTEAQALAPYNAEDMGDHLVRPPESPVLGLVDRATKARFVEMKEALKSIPSGVATTQKKTLSALLRRLLDDHAIARCQVAHLRQRLAEAAGEDVVKATEAKVTHRAEVSAVLRAWGADDGAI